MNLSVKAILLGRCPRCGEGQMFRPGLAGLVLINDNCEVCDLRILRETGYFLGAMYVSYGLGVFTVLPVAIVLALVVEWPIWAIMTVMALQTLTSAPLFLRLSRSIWFHVDYSFDPRGSTGPQGRR